MGAMGQQQRTMQRGTFSAAAIQALQGDGDAQKRTADATSRTARGVDRIRRHLENMEFQVG
jgi:hypothetical protein